MEKKTFVYVFLPARVSVRPLTLIISCNHMPVWTYVLGSMLADNTTFVCMGLSGHSFAKSTSDCELDVFLSSAVKLLCSLIRCCDFADDADVSAGNNLCCFLVLRASNKVF